MQSILNHMRTQCNWLKSCQICLADGNADGAIKRYPDQGGVVPYFANFTALALLEDPTAHPLVERYLNWYLRNIEHNGVIFDYHYDDIGNSTKSKPDSEDSYAGTYLSLVCAYHSRSRNVEWAGQNLCNLKKIARVIISLQDRDGLTFASAGYRVKYLMDNCESYRGLKNFADLLVHLGDPDSGFFQAKATAIAEGIEKTFWNPVKGCYYASKSGRISNPVSLSIFYPDAAAQIFPALYGLTAHDAERTVATYRSFNANQPDWVYIRPPDFPWMILAYYAYLHGDYRRVYSKIRQAIDLYIKTKSGCWYSAESAFFVLTCAKLLQQTYVNHPTPTVLWPGAV